MSFDPAAARYNFPSALPKERWIFLDLLRGIAILFMIPFHLIFDLNYFFGIESFSYTSGVWYCIGKLSALLFIGSSGMTSVIISEQSNDFGSKKDLKRAIIVGGWALVITIVTTFLLPKTPISFGILHFLAISMLLAPLLVRLSWKIAFGIGVCSILLGFFIKTLIIGTNVLAPIGLTNGHFLSLDYYPLFPWIGVTLLGISFGTLILQSSFRNLLLLLPAFPGQTSLAWIGRHSLAIYLIHQPVLLLILFNTMR